MTTIGYLVPEFPGQTHAFFWREIGQLKKRGYDLVLLSTKSPAKTIQPHTWGVEAQSRTWYLHPIGLSGLGLVARGLLAAGPVGLIRALRLAQGEPGGGLKRKLRNHAMILHALELTGLCRHRGIRHIHVHSCAEAAFIAALTRRLGGPSYSITLHGPLRDYGPQQRLKWRHADFAIVITKQLEKQVKDAIGDDLPDHLSIAPMGVDLAQFERQSPYQPWTGQRPAVLFSCARLNYIKGFGELIEAIKRLADRGLDVTLRIAGQDEQGGSGYARTLQTKIDELGLSDRIILLGSQPAEMVREELQKADAFVLASHAEPLGVAIMESMAMGVPTITTNAGGVPELVDHTVDGYLVAPREVEALADGIETVLRDPALATRLASAGRAKIARSFHSGVSAEVIARGLDRVLGESRNKPESIGAASLGRDV